MLESADAFDLAKSLDCRGADGGRHRAGAWPVEHDEGRLAEPLAEPDAAPRAPPSGRDPRRDDRDLDARALRRQRMVVLNRIYTRTGDEGTTSLGNAERRKKYDLRVDAYGTLDEANAVIGIARLHTGDAPRLDALLARVQTDLFDVEAEL